MEKNGKLISQRIKFDDIRKLADKVRKDYNVPPDLLPVTVEKIIEFKLKLDIIPKFGLKSEHDIEAFLSNDLKSIFVDSTCLMDDRYQKRLRFTLAHELGHYFLHQDIYKSLVFNGFDDWVSFINTNDDNVDWFEKQAHEFAGRLLVPREVLLSKISSLKSQIEEFVKKKSNNVDDMDKNVMVTGISKKICDDFGVSHEVIKARISRERIFHELGLDSLFYNNDCLPF
jgi:Zn-dependent peptidase ImmA (M78 family)